MEINDIKECRIDNNGEFKYIQILITEKEDKNKSKLIIRGSSYFSHHKEIFDDFISEIKNSKNDKLINNYDYNCIGGGKIEFNGKMISVYGYSVTYGQADHYKTVEILKKYYPNKTIINS